MIKPVMITAVALAAVAMLQGCSLSPKHECPLNEHGARSGACANMQAALAASQGPVRPGSVSVFEGQAQTRSEGAAAPAVGTLSAYPEPDKAMPVFQQPKVYRPWLAPYVDADGVLHSGEYAYFSTPGRWNYGQLKKPGGGAAVMGPAKPWDTGFVPREATQPREATRALAAPPEPAGSGKQGSAAPVEQPPSITQPYQRLN